MRLFLVIIFLIGFSININAQKNYSEGYIITLKNDTIKGKVKDTFPLRLTKKISFIDTTGIEKDYSPKDIVGYSKEDTANYLSTETAFGKYFARIIVNGEITLISYISNSTNSTMNANGGMTMSSSSYETFYLYNRITETTVEVSRIGFKNAMADYFFDCPKLKGMILNKELRYADLKIIVEQYNKCK